MGRIITSIVLLFLSFLGLIFLGIDIDEKLKGDENISHTLWAYYFGAAVVCGFVMGMSSTFLLMNL